MKPVTKQDWIDALRSGEFKQGTGVLARRDPETGTTSYCCLGVLATIAGVDARAAPREVDMLFDFDDNTKAFGMIPEAYRNTIVSDLNLSTLVAMPSRPGSDVELVGILSNKNDSGATFEDIATYLEELA